MSYELKIKNHKGEVLNLTQSADYTPYKITGLNPPHALVSTSANATLDGSKINSVRVEKRNIVLYLALSGNIENNRIQLYKYFPLKKMVTLFFENDSRKVSIEGVVEYIECDMFSRKEIAQISLICSQPYFKDVDELISNFSDVTALFEFPFSLDENGVEISELTTNLQKSIINAGDIETGAVIEMYAIKAVVNPVIRDVNKGVKMEFNLSMAVGDLLVINTNAGEKSITLVRSGINYNGLGYLTPDSGWLTLDSGDNVFTYGATSGSSDLQISVRTAVLYGGV